MGRPRASDPCISITLSVPLSTLSRLQRVAATLRKSETPQITARDLLLHALASEEGRLHLPPLVTPALPPTPTAVVPGSAADHARAPVPPVPPPAAPPEAPRVPGEGPWLPPPNAVEEFFQPPAGKTPDEVFESLLPKAHP